MLENKGFKLDGVKGLKIQNILISPNKKIFYAILTLRIINLKTATSVFTQRLRASLSSCS